MNEQEIFQTIIDGRDIEVDTFLNPRYEDLLDPLALPDIKKALKRLKKAKENNELVGVYGDYDIDGLSATTLLSDAFTSFDIRSIGFIPDRFVDGYGMSINGVDELNKKGVKLIVTVDCGSRSEKEIKHAEKLGIDVIVTDHHEIDEIPKSAVAVVNPKRSDSKYKFSDRCGAGVAFGLVQAMQKSGFEGLDEGQEKWLLDLVALATVADIVELKEENRILLKWGLEVLKRTKRAGILALMQASDFKPEEIDEIKIGFRLGPRLNAAGRIEHGKLALELLMETNLDKAFIKASKLEDLNNQRRLEQDTAFKEAIKLAKKDHKDDAVLVLNAKNWAQGVVGIVAAKLVEATAKPAFVLQDVEEGVSKGSARSFGDFDLAKALKKIRSNLLSGGGHKYAAGVTLKTKDISKIRKTLNDYYTSLSLKNQEKLLKPIPEITLESFEGMSLKLVELLDQLAPFGEGNPPVNFLVENVRIAEFRGVGMDNKHAKIKLEDNMQNFLNGIGFSLSKEVEELLSNKVNVTGRLSRNEFNGYVSPQFELLVIEAAK